MKPCKLCQTPTSGMGQICDACQASMTLCQECGCELNMDGTCPGCASGSSGRGSKPLGYGRGEWFAAVIIFILVLGGLLLFSGDDEPMTASDLRTERIERQFSPLNGSHRNLERAIKAAMNDPDSYEHVNTGYADDGDSLRVQTTYRGRNALGGVVTERVTARVSMNGEVLEILEQ